MIHLFSANCLDILLSFLNKFCDIVLPVWSQRQSLSISNASILVSLATFALQLMKQLLGSLLEGGKEDYQFRDTRVAAVLLRVHVVLCSAPYSTVASNAAHEVRVQQLFDELFPCFLFLLPFLSPFLSPFLPPSLSPFPPSFLPSPPFSLPLLYDKPLSPIILVDSNVDSWHLSDVHQTSGHYPRRRGQARSVYRRLVLRTWCLTNHPSSDILQNCWCLMLKEVFEHTLCSPHVSLRNCHVIIM